MRSRVCFPFEDKTTDSERVAWNTLCSDNLLCATRWLCKLIPIFLCHRSSSRLLRYDRIKWSHSCKIDSVDNIFFYFWIDIVGRYFISYQGKFKINTEILKSKAEPRANLEFSFRRNLQQTLSLMWKFSRMYVLFFHPQNLYAMKIASSHTMSSVLNKSTLFIHFWRQCEIVTWNHTVNSLPWKSSR